MFSDLLISKWEGFAVLNKSTKRLTSAQQGWTSVGGTISAFHHHTKNVKMHHVMELAFLWATCDEYESEAK